jgi:ribonuclease HI
MKLYFYGKSFSGSADTPGKGIISIMLPDLGVMYRTQFEGTQSECEFTAAIMAVKFVENNKELLSRQELVLLSDSSELVNQVNQKTPLLGKKKVYRDIILMYLKKYNLKIAWIPHSENRAAGLLPDLPPLKLNLNLDFDFGQAGKDSALSDREDLKNKHRIN